MHVHEFGFHAPSVIFNISFLLLCHSTVEPYCKSYLCNILMAVSFSSSHSCRKQWWRRSPNTCCSKKIELLLAWTISFNLSLYTLLYIAKSRILPNLIATIAMLVLGLLAPLVGWLSDVKFERYKMIHCFHSWPAYWCSLGWLLKVLCAKY